MSHIDIFQSSRYIDYDYDKECIFGFDADGEDNNMIFGLANNNNSELNQLKLKPLLHLPVELIGDSWWRSKHNYNKTPYYHPRTPSPISPQATHLRPPPLPLPLPLPHTPRYNNRILYGKYGKYDQFDARATDKRIKLAFSSPETMNYADTIVRSDVENGEFYETHGTQYIIDSYSWKFILHDSSCMIVGLIDADIVGKQKMNVFIDTQSQYFASLFSYSNGTTKGKELKEGCVIQMSYDKSHKTNGKILIKNITHECNDYGKEIVAVSNINTCKRYKLTILLNKPSTITMFQ